MSRHYVYILKCRDSSLYTGYTTDLKRRIRMHSEGKGAKYTRGRGPFTLVHVEEFAYKWEALQREAEIKQLKREQKWRLIQGGNSGGLESI